MILYIFVCTIALFLSTALCENLTVPEKAHQIRNNISTGAELDLLNKTKLSSVSEGGTLLPNTPEISLPKQNVTSLLSLDEELTITKEKAVKPRKGVDNLLADTNTDSKISSESINNISTTLTDLNLSSKNSSGISLSKEIHTDTILNKTSVELKKPNTTEVHKKPLILSHEALVNMEKNIQSDQSKMPVVPSIKTLASSQIPSPNGDSIVKVYPSKAANSHPGMVMPIVITILVVPMFAIVGYMALRRGQEAWKNRHYKRMDFLLDGMYND